MAINFNKKNKRIVVILGAAIGRIGSSAIMNLLNSGGVCVGGKKSGLTGPSVHNKKGFFEIRKLNIFLKNIYGKYYSDSQATPSLNFVINTSKKHIKWFRAFIMEEFGDEKIIAIKGGRCLLFPFFYMMRNEFDVKVLMLHRNEKNQIKSIINVWSKIDNKKNIRNLEYITKFLRNWKIFVKEIKKKYNSAFSYLDVHFEDLMTNPIETSDKIFDFIGINRISEDTVNKIIEKKYVNFIG